MVNSVLALAVSGRINMFCGFNSASYDPINTRMSIVGRASRSNFHTRGTHADDLSSALLRKEFIYRALLASRRAPLARVSCAIKKTLGSAS